MMLSVIMPVYNERATVVEVVDLVLAVPLEKELVIVDDGSTDGTRELLAGIDDPRVRVVLHEKNLGKGGAVRTGLAQAHGHIVLIQDADMEYDPSDYPALLEPIVQGKARVVYGSRILREDNPRGGLSFYLGGRLVTLATNLLFGSRLTDEPTCYKVFVREVLLDTAFISNGFAWEPEVTAKILKKGIGIVEVPISYRPRDVAHGKKIRARDGLEAIWTLLKYRFLPS